MLTQTHALLQRYYTTFSLFLHFIKSVRVGLGLGWDGILFDLNPAVNLAPT